MKKLIAALFLAAACVTAFSFAGSAYAANEYKDTYYALRNSYFSVEDLGCGVEVYNPSGDRVAVSGGKIHLGTAGDYTVKSGREISLIKVYKTAPEVTIRLDGEISDAYVAGEAVYLPKAVGESTLKTYAEYEVYAGRVGETPEYIDGDAYFIPKSGEYAVKYVFTDVFGIETVYEHKFTASGKPVLVVQRLPKALTFGESLTLDGSYGYNDGTIYECGVTVTDARGARELDGKVFSPRCTGENKLVFTCSVGGVVLTKEAVIEVNYGTGSLFTAPSAEMREDVEYPSCANVNKSGVYFKGDSGAKIYYNKTVNLKKLSESKTDIINLQPLAKDGSITQARVVMQDVYDANNSVGVYWWLNEWNAHLSYMLVEYDGYGLGICNEKGASNYNEVRNQYGTVAYHNFTGVDNKSCVPFNFRYDFGENAVYSRINSATPNFKVLDLDDKAALKSYPAFGGFKGEEVYLYVELTVSGGGGVVISEIGGEQIGNAADAYKNDGVIQVLHDTDIKEGVVGYPFVLPRALEEDVLFGKTAVTREIYREDEKIDVTGEIFIPEKSGNYRAVFTAYDNFGKKTEKVYGFTVKASPTDIVILTNAVGSVGVREDFILPEASVSGGTGGLNVSYTVEYGGEVFRMQPFERFTVEKTGVIKVTVKVKDDLGFEKTAEYDVRINSDKKFIIATDVPKAAVNGGILNYPEFTALDYSKYGTAGFEMTASVYIDGALVTGDYRVDTDKDFIELKLVGGNDEVSEIHRVAVIPALTDTIADYLVYDKNSVTTEFYETGLNFKFSKDVVIEMPFAVPYYDLSFGITYLADSLNFGRTDVTLVSSADAGERVTLTLTGVSGGAASLNVCGVTHSLKINGGTYTLGSYKGRAYSEIYLSVSRDGTLSLSGNEFGKITKFDNGRAFSGFTGGKVYLVFGIEGVTGESSFVINQVANQSFNLYTKDYDETVGIVGLTSAFGDEYVKGETVTLPKAVFGDVLSGKATATVTVRAPDGTELYKDVSPDADITVKLESYGYYRFIFTVTDGAANTGDRVFRVRVADKTPPTVSFAKNIAESMKAGARLTVPEVNVSDDYSVLGDEDNPLTYFIYLRKPSTELVRVNVGDRITLADKGRYALIIYAYDAAFNAGCSVNYIGVK